MFDTSLVVLFFGATIVGEGMIIASRARRLDDYFFFSLKELFGEVFFGLVAEELSKSG